MADHLDRREFLKLLQIFSLGLSLPFYLRVPEDGRSTDQNQANILIIVFDAFSSYHLSLYGYERQTTPNISRIANRATVYHNHYAGGSWTPPGTASLITGTYPWKHRIFSRNEPYITTIGNEDNLFSGFNNYYRSAYTHNRHAEFLLKQMLPFLNDFKPKEFLYFAKDKFINTYFSKDEEIASLSRRQILGKEFNNYAYSIILSEIYQRFQQFTFSRQLKTFPLGLPTSEGFYGFFLLEDGIDWIIKNLSTFPQPTLWYFHFLPPHYPYRTRVEFVDYFSGDNYLPPKKPEFLFQGDESQEYLNKQRRLYDEYILYVDSEFGRLYDQLEKNGGLENTILVLTSDHGELFERGIRGHYSHSLHQPVIKIPLLIKTPDQNERADVFANTSAVDLVPTLAHITGQPQPTWTEGTIIPPFVQDISSDRSVFTLDAKDNPQSEVLSAGTATIIKNDYKLILYFDHNERAYEFYNIKNDPEELNNIYSPNNETPSAMQKELLDKLDEADRPYSK